MNIKEVLIENPIIAAITNDNDLKKAVESNVSIVFVLYGNILNIKSICDTLENHNKIVFVHIDLIDGLKGDQMGVRFIKDTVKPFGVISTKASNIKYAKSIGMYTIQRVFVVDTLSFVKGIKNIEDNSPNAVEVMPGIAPKIISKVDEKLRCEIIAGGLIRTKSDVIEALSHGAIAVSTTTHDLWNM